jgi:hypothetical protein
LVVPETRVVVLTEEKILGLEKTFGLRMSSGGRMTARLECKILKAVVRRMGIAIKKAKDRAIAKHRTGYDHNAHVLCYKRREKRRRKYYRRKALDPGWRTRVKKQWQKKYPHKYREIRRGIELRRNRGMKASTNPKVIAKWEESWRSRPSAKCYWCSKRFKVSQCHTDHILALSIGGLHEIENLCVSCSDCNVAKSNKPLSEWNREVSQPALL